MNLQELQKTFSSIYGKGECKIYFAPGRVNLIGEHTDYNGGFVFPAALTYGTYCLLRKNNTKQFRIQSLTVKRKYTVSIKNINKPLHKGAWANYVVGVLAQFVKNNQLFDSGADMLFYGNVPRGAGLSSSAAIEVATAVAINNLYGFENSPQTLAQYSQKAEHEFAGVMCGIMDQFASAMGKKNHGIYLNCDTLHYEMVPLKLNGIKIIISNTNSPHRLGAGEYNQRVKECNMAVAIIQQQKPINVLADISLSELMQLKHLFSDAIIFKRALHVISEIERTAQAVAALKQNNIAAFGKLMNQSHQSLKENYEVTGLHLDTMVQEAQKIDGVIGSRMTGGGFGGSTVSLVQEDCVAQFIEEVGEAYEYTTGLHPEFYVADIGDGGHQVIPVVI